MIWTWIRKKIFFSIFMVKFFWDEKKRKINETTFYLKRVALKTFSRRENGNHPNHKYDIAFTGLPKHLYIELFIKPRTYVAECYRYTFFHCTCVRFHISNKYNNSWSRYLCSRSWLSLHLWNIETTKRYRHAYFPPTTPGHDGNHKRTPYRMIRLENNYCNQSP